MRLICWIWKHRWGWFYSPGGNAPQCIMCLRCGRMY